MNTSSKIQAKEFLMFLENVVKYPDSNNLTNAILAQYFENPALASLVSDVMSNVTDENVATSNQVVDFKKLSNEQIIRREEGASKRQSISKQVEDESDDCKVLRGKIKVAKLKKKKLEMDINVLKTHNNDVLKKTTDANNIKARSKTDLVERREECKATLKSNIEGFNKLNKAFNVLLGLLQCSKHSCFMSQTSLMELLQAEEYYITELTKYVKLQFSNISESISQDLSEIDKHQVQNISDETLLIGETEEVRSSINKEIQQWIHSYPKLKKISISSNAKDKAAEFSLSEAENILKELKATDTEHVMTESELSKKFFESQKEIESLKNKIADMSGNVLSALVSENTPLQSTYIMTGNYKLKLTRQMYYEEKQRYVVSLLLQQRARLDVLWMLLDVEETGQTKTEKQLPILFQNLEKLLEESQRVCLNLAKLEKNTSKCMSNENKVIMPTDVVDNSIYDALSDAKNQSDDTQFKLISDLNKIAEDLVEKLSLSKIEFRNCENKNKQITRGILSTIETSVKLVKFNIKGDEISPRNMVKLTESTVQNCITKLNKDYAKLLEHVKVDLAEKEKKEAHFKHVGENDRKLI